jgi:cytoskeletal protein RodZ
MSIDTDQPATDAADPSVVLANPAVVDAAIVHADEAPSIGARLVEARTAQGRSVEDLSGQTHLRATVIRSIETDDFRVCGGDCYARGHLRLLGQALSIDAYALVESFDQNQAAIAPLEEPEVDDWSPRMRPHRRSASLLALCTALVAAAAALLLAVLL